MGRPKLGLQRIFVITNLVMMENQYCRVGAVKPITNGAQAISILEYRYQIFLEKASNIGKMDEKLADFFESKANSIKKTLENLI